MLYVCATPIGNMEDITLRVLRVLSEVSLIAAEDTRRTVKLLNRYEIHTPMTSCHAHNERAKADKLLAILREGRDVALVSDAGMPGISDPGQALIQACLAEGIAVTVCPGATAGVSALVGAGLGGRHVFEGFLPTSKKERTAAIEALKTEARPVILYEAPHRIIKTITELQTALGDRTAHIARELTKAHEEWTRDTLSGHMERFKQKEPRGEFVIVLEGAAAADNAEAPQTPTYPADLAAHVAQYAAQGLPEKEAMRRAASERGMTRREVYRVLKIEGGATE